MARPVGKPPKYSSAEQLTAAIQNYFDDCAGIPAVDDDGIVINDKNGFPVWRKLPKPLTIMGLGLALGFLTRQSLLDYEGKKEYVDIILRARMIVDADYEAGLRTREGARGSEFYLSRHGWTEKVEDKTPVEIVIKGDVKALAE